MKLVAKPIDAVVVFSVDESPRPCKIRYTDAEGTNHDLRVDKVLSVDEKEIPGVKFLVFECQSNKNGIDFRYQLKYDISSCKWMLYKI